MNTCFDSKTVTARKPHHCFFCGELIEKGNSYHKREGVNDSGLWKIKAHHECDKATSEWSEEDYLFFNEGSLKRGSKFEKDGTL